MLNEKFLVKYSSVEFGEEWWFLDEVLDSSDWERILSVDGLHFLKDMHRAKFIKRYSSREELELDVFVKYGNSIKLKQLH